MAFEKTGVQAVVQGATDFISTLDKVQASYNKTAATFQKGVAGKSGIDILGGVAIGAAAGVAMTAVNALTSAVSAGARAVSEFASSSVQLAQANQGIEASFNALAATTGISLDTLRQSARSTISDLELMRTTNVALTGAGKDLSTEFGKNIPNLLQAARVAARATGQDVGFLYNSLITGIKRSSPMLIDNTGLVLKVGAANDAMAAKVGKAVEDLSAEEKQIAILNATVEAGQRMVAQYGDSYGSLAESQARASAQAENLKVSFGNMLLPALTTLNSTWANFLYYLNQAISEGGTLYPVIVGIGTALSMIADGAAIAVEAIMTWLDSLDASFGQGLADVAETALRWGVEIITALAEGIVMGATSALNFAMDAVGSMLSWWLAPGSPPKVAPDMDKWGAAAMTSYLQGFSEADFDVLEKVQGALSQVLSAADLQSVSAQLMQALSAGDVGPGFFDTITAAAGEFGAQIAELARRELTLSDAVLQVEQSEKALQAAQKGVTAQQADVMRLRREYNNLLRSGASQKELDAKLAEVRASEDQLVVSRKAAVQAYNANEAAKENVSVLEERLNLQDRLVKQLLALSKAQQKVTTEKEAEDRVEKAKLPKAGEGITAPEAGGIALPGVSAAPMVSGIGKAIEDMKAAVKSKMADIFSPLTTSWETRMRPAISSFIAEWNIFVWRIKYKWGELATMFDSVNTGIENMIPEETRKSILDFFAGIAPYARPAIVAITGFTTVVGLLSMALGFLASPVGRLVMLLGGVGLGFTKMIEGMSKLVEIFNEHEGDVVQMGRDILQWIGEGVTEMMEKPLEWINGIIARMSEGLQTAWYKVYTMGANISKVIGEGIASMAEFIKFQGIQFVTWIKAGVDLAKATLDSIGTSIVNGVNAGVEAAAGTLNTIGNTIATKIKEGVEWAGSEIDAMATAITDGIDAALNSVAGLAKLASIGAGIASAIVTGIEDSYQAIYDAVWSIIEAAWAAFQAWLKDKFGIEESSASSATSAVGGGAAATRKTSGGGGVIGGNRAAMPSIGAQTQQIYRNANTTIGPVYINSGIDQIAFQAMVERAVVRALR